MRVVSQQSETFSIFVLTQLELAPQQSRQLYELIMQIFRLISVEITVGNSLQLLSRLLFQVIVSLPEQISKQIQHYLKVDVDDLYACILSTYGEQYKTVYPGNQVYYSGTSASHQVAINSARILQTDIFGEITKAVGYSKNTQQEL